MPWATGSTSCCADATLPPWKARRHASDMSLQATASQTAGPFFHLGLTDLVKDNLVLPGGHGEELTIRGHVRDGNGAGVSDALIEMWQAGSKGRYAHPEGAGGESLEAMFRRFGRIHTRQQGIYAFTTIKPGRVPGCGESLQAPHIVVSIFARGLLKQLVTRIYFPDEPSNAEDTVLNLVPAERRSTLIPKRVADAQNLLEWDIVLQGRD